MIYFIRPGRRSFVKVGFAVDVEHRLKDLQCANPDKLRVIGVIPGSRATEARVHKALAGHRQSGEWFRLNKFVREAIKSLSSAQDTEAAIEALFPTVKPVPIEEIRQAQRTFFEAVESTMGLRPSALARRSELNPGTVNGWVKGSCMPAWAIGQLGQKGGVPDSILSILCAPYRRRIYSQERAVIVPILRRAVASGRRAAR